MISTEKYKSWNREKHPSTSGLKKLRAYNINK